MAKKTQEEIQQSIDQATREWQERKAQQEEYSNQLKAGGKFCKENNVKYIRFAIFDHYITLGYYVDRGMVRYSYAICSPKDSFSYSYKTAANIIGKRFLEHEAIVPNLIVSTSAIYRISSYEIESICKANFKYLLQVESVDRNTVINAPRKLLNYVRDNGVI